MIIKNPPVYDISAWKEVPDFALVNPRPLLFITKATEADNFKDSKFIRFFEGMKSIGVARGCYHFHRKAVSAVAQANNFILTVTGHIDDNDLLILDVEEGGETAMQLKRWIDTVRAAFPKNQIIVYSTRFILNAIIMTAAQKDFFKTMPVWIAGYPNNPDLYSQPPNVYLPDPFKWGKVVLWQYSEKGVVAGIEGAADLNWIDPSFAASLKVTLPPAPAPAPSPDPSPIKTLDRVLVTIDGEQYYTTNVPLIKVDV